MKKNFLFATALLSVIVIGFIGYQRMKKPLVSVVMLTYKRADIVPEAIESILNQTYKNFELIILNDGSPDNTDDVIAGYLKKDSRISYYKNDKNRGIAYSRNRVTALAKGKYVAIMDDDDISLPNRLEKQVDFMEKNPEIDVLAGQIKDLSRIPESHNEIATGLIQYNNFGNANTMYRRQIVQKYQIKYPNFNYGEDWHFWLQILFKGGKFAAISDDVVIRRGDSKKHYSAKPETSHELIHQFVGNFFSPENTQAFYKADACSKLNMIKKAPVQIFTKDYLQNLIQSNCFSN